MPILVHIADARHARKIVDGSLFDDPRSVM